MTKNISHAIKTKLGRTPAKVMVIGDIMLDTFKYGQARYNPEDHIAPCIDVRKETSALGGAANVANNVVELNGKVLLYGMVGEDQEGERIQRMMEERGIKFHPAYDGRQTTQKVRIMEMERNRMAARYDREDRTPISRKTQRAMLSKIEEDMGGVEAVILSDYGKGIFSGWFTKRIIEEAGKYGVPVISDCKPENVRMFRHSTLICPNTKEAAEITRIKIPEEGKGWEAMAKKLEVMVKVRYVVITRGAEGMISWESGGEMRTVMNAAREVYDVTGAGDTVAATLAVCMAKKYSHNSEETEFSIHDAAEVANHAGGIVVGKMGTATTTLDEIVSHAYASTMEER